MSSLQAFNAAGHLSSAIRQLTKTQTKSILLSLVQDTYNSSDDLKQIVEPFIFDRLSHHIQVAIEEDERINTFTDNMTDDELLEEMRARLSPVPDSVMEQELEAVDGLLDSYSKFADTKLLSDVTVKMNDLFVILQSRAKEQKWQGEVQQRVAKLNSIRGKDFPDPSIFNTGYQKRGWMDKRTRSFKGWKRRWFVLKGTHLTYFAKTDASSVSSAEWGEITHEGMLRKKKQGKGWKNRWAQIRPEGLLYFKSQKDKEPIGALPFLECERVENPAEKSFEVTYNGVKYYFTVEHDGDFAAWSHAFAGVCPELSHDPNMSTFTIRGVIDLATSILDDKNTDKPYCFSITVEGGKTFVFAVDSDRQKQEWLNLIGIAVKTDHSSRKTRSNSNLNGSGLIRQQLGQEKGGTNGPESPAPVRFAFKDEVMGRPLSVRTEGESFDSKFQTMEVVMSDDDEEETAEGEEAARERTKMVRRETIKLIRTFKLEVHLEDQREIYTFAFDNSVLVDQVKSYLFKHIPVLNGCNQADYSLGVDADRPDQRVQPDDLLTVEFLRFVSSNTFIEVAVRTCGIARVGLFLRDNLRKINEQRAARGRPLKTTSEQADQHRIELEHKLQIERTERERLENELKEKAATEKRLIAEKLLKERELERMESEKQSGMRTYTTSATQTEEEKDQQQPGSEKFSWRSQVLPSSSIAKKAESMLKASVPSGSGIVSGTTAEGKPKTMITKTHPRAPTTGGWQQVQPSLSATKRPMIIPCEGWSIEVPGELLPLPAIKSWQFAIAMDNALSETPEPFFYRKHFITAKKTTNFLGSDPKYGAISFSICTNTDGFRGVLFTKLGTRQISVGPTAMKVQPSIKSRKQQMIQFLLSKLESSINPKNLRLSLHPDMQKELLSLEERQVCSGFKFGVVYAKGGQSEENELFNNEHGSEEWNEFLDVLGTRIQLKGWAQYNAGLDVKSNTTGTHSLYTNWKGNEVMFHVSTMLPFHPEDPQKLERKRHVGNDICVIVFQEGATPYLPSTITSHFNHIIAVVHYDKAVGGYRLGFAFKDGVPAFGPVLNSHGFVKKADLKEHLLTKLINGETASLLAPVFAQKLVRTREALLNYYLQQFL